MHESKLFAVIAWTLSSVRMLKDGATGSNGGLNSNTFIFLHNDNFYGGQSEHLQQI